MFAKNGPEGLRLSEVAHLASVNGGAAYRHFATREELVKAAANRSGLAFARNSRFGGIVAPP